VRERHFAMLGEAFDASSLANGGNGGEAIGSGAEADGANGHKGGVPIGARSEADGGGDALDAGHTDSGCSTAIGSPCFTQPGK